VKRRSTKSLRLSPGKAAVALQMLVSEGKLAAREVHAALRRRQALIQQLQDLQDRLAALGPDKDGPFPMHIGRTKTASKTKRRVSAVRRAAMKVQGRYMAAIRRLPKAARARVKAIRKKSGVASAIREARRLQP
jgi:hypothetical protein